ncbi:peptidase m24 [Ophiostoma piceae UAMH 11346]|uniref:Peptidase m24 n=1 Tax=Ophiostoma piceae (strain UAMH 11346) TaxID=1262450 RepID=S3C9G8_OPHP1|nr:peptidase m24 [Ophiostoma piceae UAMH 11346]
MATAEAIAAFASDAGASGAERTANLVEAQNKAASMFVDIERDLVRSGVTEKDLTDAIYKLGQEKYNVRTHWHKRVVRSGPHTLSPFKENLPDRTIGEDDILFVDLGPVFEEYEADFGRTFVLGSDPDKLALRDALEPLWFAIKQRFDESPNMTCAEMYKETLELTAEAARKNGRQWTYGNDLFCGHLVGNFPHERIPNDKVSLYLTTGNPEPVRSLDNNGQQRHWILEIYLYDEAGGFGGFFEQIMTVDY